MPKASFREVESGIPPASLAPRNGRSRSVFRSQPKVLPGRGSWEGSYGPEEGSGAGELWMRQEMKVTGYRDQWGKVDGTPGVLGEVTWGSQNGTLSAERDPIPLHNPPITSSLTVLPQASWVAPKGPGSVPLNRGRLQICLPTENGSISHTLRHPRGSLNLFSIHLEIVCIA